MTETDTLAAAVHRVIAAGADAYNSDQYGSIDSLVPLDVIERILRASGLLDVAGAARGEAAARDTEAADLAFTVRALQIGISKTTNERDAAYEVLREIDRSAEHDLRGGEVRFINPTYLRSLIAKVPGIHAAQKT